MSSLAVNATIVLVHGAWADGSCWQNVILPLCEEGLKVTCAPFPVTSLSDDIAALERTMERTSGPVVLARHAYAGAVIAGPGDARVRSLVYVAALATAEGGLPKRRLTELHSIRQQSRTPSRGRSPQSAFKRRRLVRRGKRSHPGFC